jgi:O-antigen/teichoic acid export membrane protein
MRARHWQAEVWLIRKNPLRSSALLGLCDQAMASFGNFALNVLMARSFGERDYGAFALTLSVAIFLNSLHQAYVTFPLSVRAAASSREESKYLAAVGALMTLALAPLFCAALLPASAGAGKTWLFPFACLFLITWQMQEVYRRALMAQSRFAAVLATDALRYITPLLGLAALNRLSVPRLHWDLAGLALASLAAGYPLFLSCANHSAAAWRARWQEVRVHWRMASPLLGANILAAFSSQWFLWLLASTEGLAASGAMVALVNIASVCNPVLYGTENILVPEAARLRARGVGALKALLRRRMLMAMLLLAPAFLAVQIWPAFLLQHLYGGHHAYGQYAGALRLLVAGFVVWVGAAILGAGLRGFGDTGSVLRMQVWSALVGMTLGSILTLRFGVAGASAATLAGALVRFAVAWRSLARLRHLRALPDESPLGQVIPDMASSA